MDVGDLEHRMFLFFDMYLRKVEEIMSVIEVNRLRHENHLMKNMEDARQSIE